MDELGGTGVPLPGYVSSGGWQRHHVILKVHLFWAAMPASGAVRSHRSDDHGCLPGGLLLVNNGRREGDRPVEEEEMDSVPWLGLPLGMWPVGSRGTMAGRSAKVGKPGIWRSATVLL